MGVSPTGPGCEPAASAADASSQSRIPNAERDPLFPSGETIYIASLSLQERRGDGIHTAYVMGAAMNDERAKMAALNQWRETYPGYLATEPFQAMKIRRARPAKKALFWGGFFTGFWAFPAAILAAALIASAMSGFAQDRKDGLGPQGASAVGASRDAQ